jgi:hypothetical protein
MDPRWSTVAVLLAAVLVTSPARAIEHEIEKVFPVQPGCTVNLDTYRGQIVIEESDAPQVAVSVHLDFDVDTDQEAQELRSKLQLDLSARENTVTITARNSALSGPHLDIGGDKQILLAFHVVVPRRCNVTVRAREGSATIGNLTGQITAQLDKGTIFCRTIDGTVRADTGVGDIVVSRCSGALTAHVRQGSIRVGTIGGPAELTNATGDIEVMTAAAAITARAELGNIGVTFPRDVSGDAKLTTAAGNIVAKIEPGANCLIDASAVFGTVTSRLPINTEVGVVSRRRLVGQLNRGGPVLTLHSGGGSVQIEPGNAPFEH